MIHHETLVGILTNLEKAKNLQFRLIDSGDERVRAEGERLAQAIDQAMHRIIKFAAEG